MPRQAIFILTDTQGTDVIGCYGRSDMQTPHIDRMASEGIRFDRAYSTQPVCGPARSAIFTGMYPHSNGVLGNDMAPALDMKTLGQRLSDSGVRTGFVGKWHLDGTDYFGNGVCPDGWDPEYWFDGRCYLDSLKDKSERDFSRLVPTAQDMRYRGLDETFTMAHRSVDKAIDFIERYKDEDFFLVVSIDEPHHPFICPAEYLEAFEGFEFKLGENAKDDLADKPQSQRDWAEHVAEFMGDGKTFRLDPFFACNSYCDYEVGRVLGAIEKWIPDALSVYTSDHGDMLGAHRLLGKGPTMYNEIAKIPFVVKWKGSAPENSSVDRPISHIDLAPTFLEFFGQEVPEILQGESLLPTFAEPSSCSREQAFLEFNRFELDHDGFGGFSPTRCVVTERFKLAINLTDKDELYDLETDPGEMRNLIDDPAHAEMRNQLHDEIAAWMDRTRDPFRGPQWKNREWRDQGIKSWGGPTRPHPFDGYNPRSLLYDTAEEIDRLVYEKH
jgi:arylsulfatase A-like enzyme